MSRHFVHTYTSEIQGKQMKISIIFLDARTSEKALHVVYQNDLISIQNQQFFQPGEEQMMWLYHGNYSFFVLQSLEHKALQLLKDDLPNLSKTLNLQLSGV